MVPSEPEGGTPTQSRSTPIRGFCAGSVAMIASRLCVDLTWIPRTRKGFLMISIVQRQQIAHARPALAIHGPRPLPIHGAAGAGIAGILHAGVWECIKNMGVYCLPRSRK